MVSKIIEPLQGLLGEFGITLPKGVRYVRSGRSRIFESDKNELPVSFRCLMQRLFNHFDQIDTQIKEIEQDIQTECQENEACRRLVSIPGIGPITATALVATVGNACEFENGRHLAAWLGLVPRQHSTGGKPRLLGISKRGDGYIRRMLIHGARAVIRFAPTKEKPDPWLLGLLQRKHKNVVTTALANKNARIVWALLTRGSSYQDGYRIKAA